jgi:Ni/Co efflux regulator RcnB
MKTTAIVCAVLAATMGFSTIASAQQWSGRHDRGDQRQHQRSDRHEQRQQNWNHDRQDRRGGDRNWGHSYNQPRYVYQQPRYVYNAPRYYSHGPRFYRGGYLPHQYLNSGYYVGNWQAYPGLYAPPYGYQWVNVGGDFLLVALATGLIANLLMQ